MIGERRVGWLAADDPAIRRNFDPTDTNTARLTSASERDSGPRVPNSPRSRSAGIRRPPRSVGPVTVDERGGRFDTSAERDGIAIPGRSLLVNYAY